MPDLTTLRDLETRLEQADLERTFAVRALENDLLKCLLGPEAAASLVSFSGQTLPSGAVLRPSAALREPPQPLRALLHTIALVEAAMPGASWSLTGEAGRYMLRVGLCTEQSAMRDDLSRVLCLCLVRALLRHLIEKGERDG